uniref:Helitron helicase-like domain-containing protein n=1 Tax=Lactuca sativa TaxID=4236 RepID=A0A9R1XEE5_LACSA|nr:hypothetical protein LSAT_V11C400203600 [Lactuca sativa]
MENVSEKSQKFIQNVHRYNMIFSFTSMAGKIDHANKSGGSPYVYRMHDQNYHIAGSLLSKDGELPRFYQLYIYDTDHEVQNRFKTCEYTIHELMGLLDFINPLVKQFRMAQRIRLKLIGTRENDGRQYNLPTINKVASFIIGDIDGSDLRDIYLALQYPLLFPYVEDGLPVDILHRGVKDLEYDGQIRLTMRTQHYAWHLIATRTRHENASLMGNRTIIPFSFTSGSRYIQQSYLDAMTLVKWFGYPDHFLTCNLKWTEVIRFVEAENLKPEDMPNILT